MPGTNLGTALSSRPSRRSLTRATEVVALEDDYLKPTLLCPPHLFPMILKRHLCTPPWGTVLRGLASHDLMDVILMNCPETSKKHSREQVQFAQLTEAGVPFSLHVKLNDTSRPESD